MRKPSRAGARRPAAPPRSGRSRRAALPKQLVPSISPGRASEAAQFLRKTHRPVYHRIIEGKEYRGQYVVGTQVLNEEEVIALAEEKGFEAYNRLFDFAG